MNTPWKPKRWIAVLLSLFTGSFAFLYLNHLRLFWVYFFVSITVVAVDWYFHLHFSLVVTSACVIHGYLVATKYDIEQPRHWYSHWWAIPALYTVIIGPILLSRIFIFDLFSIPAASMSPNVNIGNYIVIKKHGYGDYGAFGIKIFNTGFAAGIKATPGKIYAFYPPHQPAVAYIKRLVGKPGDQIDIKDDAISINGKPLEHKLLSEDAQYTYYEEKIGDISYKIQRTKGKPFLINQTFIVPQGHYFFLGDNRDNSYDSRLWGSVSDHSFIGELIFVFTI